MGYSPNHVDKGGVVEIDVTPEMIEAGLAIYAENCPDSCLGDSLDRRMVTKIFVAMALEKKCRQALRLQCDDKEAEWSSE